MVTGERDDGPLTAAERALVRALAAALVREIRAKAHPVATAERQEVA